MFCLYVFFSYFSIEKEIPFHVVTWFVNLVPYVLFVVIECCELLYLASRWIWIAADYAWSVLSYCIKLIFLEQGNWTVFIVQPKHAPSDLGLSKTLSLFSKSEVVFSVWHDKENSFYQKRKNDLAYGHKLFSFITIPAYQHLLNMTCSIQ